MIESKTAKIVSYTVMILLAVICVVPFLLMIAASVTSEASLLTEGYSFFPKDISLQAYEYLFADGVTIFRAYGITILVTAVGTATSLILTTLLAYAISRRHVIGRNVIAFIVFFAMLFNGGIIPSYIMWTGFFHIKNNLLAYIIPNYLVIGFYVIMMRTYFTSNIPSEVLEAARIDGAGELTILIKVVLPMAVPILATVGMMVAITYWNEWQNGLYYINDTKLYSMQVILNKMIKNADAIKTIAPNVSVQLPSVSIKMAVAVLGALPIMCVFPFFQKYYVKGITIGAVKG